MALTRISPIEAHVRWDAGTAAPREIRWNDRHLTVTAVAAVRDERAAYPADRGPRVTFLLETSGGQASVAFDGRRGRWFVEALDPAA
jgi:hypothetical protein